MDILNDEVQGQTTAQTLEERKYKAQYRKKKQIGNTQEAIGTNRQSFAL